MNTDSIKNSIGILLANRIYLYRLLQNFFGNEPTLDALAILNSDHTKNSLSLLSIENGFGHIQKLTQNLQTNKAYTLEECCSEYTRLFIGPTKLPAPPWESVYVTKERLIFQENTLKVRECYLKYDLLPVRYRSEPDDHIALELDFMASLSQMAESAFQEDRMDDLTEILTDQKSFLQEHLWVWIPQYVADLQAATNHPLYLGISAILKEFLQVDQIVIKEILETRL